MTSKLFGNDVIEAWNPFDEGTQLSGLGLNRSAEGFDDGWIIAQRTSGWDLREALLSQGFLRKASRIIAMIVLRGDGIAALVSGYLLQVAGFGVAVQRTSRTYLPALMLSASSQALFCDILELRDAFSSLPRIQKRVVKWGSRSEPVVLPHSAVIVSEQFLLEMIQPKLFQVNPTSDDADWTIVSSRPLPESVIDHAFGSRTATFAPVQLEEGSDSMTCWIESLEDGWLFLMPDTSHSGWLISVGAPLNAQLERSRMISGQVRELGNPTREFPSYPRIAWPLGGENWLACGTAALAFDPLCGDGTGHALREAILASAVVRAAARGTNVNTLIAHYQARLVAGFKRHLAVCHEFYQSGGAGPWWDSTLESVKKGLTWCDRRLDSAGEFRYRLRGLELEPIR
jgi:hypothetical protein